MRVCPDRHQTSAARTCSTCGAATVSRSLVSGREDAFVGHVLKETYRIEERIGAGGMAVVYRAQQLTVDRQVAVKVLPMERVRQGGQTPDLVRRFRREARAMSRLEHPNTIRVLDFGETDEGVFYIVMELLRGRTLAEALAGGAPLSPARVAHIGIQVAKSLAEAHACDIIHRDLKPSNIFLVDFHGERDYVKVVDFGIAKLGENDRSTAAQTRDALGTPRYMAPEQALASGVGPPADLYALGVVLYHALSGRPPFVADQAMALISHCFRNHRTA